jgi:hypothetical protein
MDIKEKVSFEGFSKRAEEICRSTALIRHYFKKQGEIWQTKEKNTK